MYSYTTSNLKNGVLGGGDKKDEGIKLDVLKWNNIVLNGGRYHEQS